MHLVIATRTDPPLRLAQLRAHGELCEIRAEDLRFTTEEVFRLFNQILKLGLTPSDIAIIKDKTEGWIAGLQLAGISLQKHPDKHTFITTFAGDDRYIADYLLDEALRHQSTHIQTFLLQTSILDRLSASLCDAVTSRNDSQKILEELENTNLFLVPLDNQRKWSRYHHLFRDLLQQRLRQTTQEGQITTLHCQASEWFIASKFIFEAIHHAFEADDMLLMVRLIEANIISMLDRGGILTLMHWLDSIPSEVRQNHPWLSVAHAWILVYAGNLASGEETLQLAEKTLILLKDDEPLRAKGYICAIRAYAAWMRGQGETGVKFSRQALAFLPEDELSVRAFASKTLGYGLIQCDDFDNATKALQDSIAWGRASGKAHIYILAAGGLAHLLILQGQIHQAELVCREAITYYQGEQTRRSPAITQIYAIMANIYLARNDLDQAFQFAQDSLKISKYWDQLDSITVSYVYLINILIAMQDFREAEAILAQAKKLSMHETTWFKNILGKTEAQINLATGNISAASQWARESGLDYRDEVPQPERTTYRTLAQVLMAEGKLSEANYLLERLIKDSESSGAYGSLLPLLPIHSIVQLGLGFQDKALKLLSRALILAEPEKDLRIFISLGEPMTSLLRLAIRDDIQPIFCVKLLEAIENEKFGMQKLQMVRLRNTPSSELQALDHLSKRELEVLRLISEGCTNQEIAQHLILTLHTVKSHARNIYSKLGVKNRTEAVARARLLGLLPQD